MKYSEIISALDIGSTKICCCVARVSDNCLEILGIGYCSCTGIVSGVIVEMESVVKSISSAVELAERQAGHRIKSIYISVSGKSMNSIVENIFYETGGRIVKQVDIDKMLYKSDVEKKNEIILHKIPISYCIDGIGGIKNPVGMLADKISAKVCVVRGSKSQISNILVCLSKCHLNVNGIVAAPYAAGLSVQCNDNLKDDMIVIDFGGGTTNISFFYKNIFCGLRSIPIGGGHITNDLSKGLGVAYADAERLKVLYGSAIYASYEDDDSVLTPVLEEDNIITMRYVLKSKINQIIQPRADELIDMIATQIDDFSYDNFSKNVILTGGACALPGISDAISLKMNVNTTLRKFEEVSTVNGIELTQAYSTAIGVLKYATQINKRENLRKENSARCQDDKQPANSIFYKITKWIKENI